MEDINPIKSPLSYEYQIPNFVWYFLLFLFFASILTYLYLKKRKQEEPKKTQETIFNPEKCIQEARKKIRTLDKNNIKKYSFDLSLILKKYFSCYYQKDFTHYTTSELLLHPDIDTGKKDILKNIFSVLDNIKFAKKQEQVFHFEKMDDLLEKIIK